MGQYGGVLWAAASSRFRLRVVELVEARPGGWWEVVVGAMVLGGRGVVLEVVVVVGMLMLGKRVTVVDVKEV